MTFDLPQSGDLSTSSGLIRGIQAGDPAAWDQWVRRYAPFTYRWLRMRGLSRQDAEDITQNAFVHVVKSIHRYRCTGPQHGFRRWLYSVIRTRMADFYRSHRTRPQSPEDDADQQKLLTLPDPHSTPCPDDLEGGEEEFSWKFCNAMAEVQLRVSPTTWKAFYGIAVDGRAPKDLSADLGISGGAVNKAFRRVCAMLREQLPPQAEDVPEGSGADSV